MIQRVMFAVLVLAVIITAEERITEVRGTQGGSIRLTPAIPHGFNTRDVYWRHLSLTEEQVASFSRGSTEMTYRSRFFGRAQLDHLHGFTLEVKDLEMDDTGVFTCLLVNMEGQMKSFKYHVTVYEAVVPATVQVFVSGGPTECSIFMRCNTTTGNNVSYTWTADTGHGDPMNASHTLYNEGRLLMVTLGPEDREASYTCTVTNPVSQQNTTVMPWGNCASLSGKNSKIHNNLQVLCMAVVIALAFVSLIACVLLHVKAAGKSKKVRNGNEAAAPAANNNEEDALQGNSGSTQCQHEEDTEQQCEDPGLHHILEMRDQEPEEAIP